MGIFDFIQPNMMVQPLGVGPMSLAPPLAKAANNATGASIPGVRAPYTDPAAMLNAMMGAAKAPSEIELARQQAALAGLNTQAAAQKIKFLGQLSALMGGADTSSSPTATPSSTTPNAPSGGSFTGGVPSDNTVSSATAPMVGGGNPEIATNNFAGMRVPGVSGGGPRSNPSGWQQFDTPESGIAAISHQLDRYASGATTGKPLTTIRQIVSTWAPPSENDTPTLIKRASSVVGVGPDDPLDVSDPGVKAKLVEAMIRGEQGGKLPDVASPDVIGRVVAAQQQYAQATPQTMTDAAPATGANSMLPVTPAARSIPAGIPPLQSGGGANLPALGQMPAVPGMNPNRILQLGLYGQLAGLPDIGKPFETFYYNSPQFLANKAYAEKAGALPLVGPAARAEAQAKQPFTAVRPGGSFPQVDANGNIVGWTQAPAAPIFDAKSGQVVYPSSATAAPIAGYPTSSAAVTGANERAKETAGIRTLGPTDTLFDLSKSLTPNTAPPPLPSTAIPSPNTTPAQPAAPAAPAGQPGVLRQGANPAYIDAVKGQADADQNRISKVIQPQVDKANEMMATSQLIQDTLPNVATGQWAEAKQNLAKVLTGLGASDETAKALLGTDPSAGDVIRKQFLIQGAAAVRQLGAREPGSVIVLFNRAYPNLETQHNAINLLQNVLFMQGQRTNDLFHIAQQHHAAAVNGLQNGQSYEPLSQTEDDFNTGPHSTINYLKAAQSMSGDAAAFKGMKPEMFDTIQALIPRGRQYLAPDGQMHVKQ